ncbi:MAG: UMP kinase [Legionella sp.]|nr:UMP kinase [Legionella sp.]
MSESTKAPLKYNRVLLKYSGEALMGRATSGIDSNVLDRMAKEVAELIAMGVEVGIVIGGGNLFRGKALSEAGLGRVTGDHMGMLATVMNALALRDAFERANLSARVMSAIPIAGLVDSYHHRKAKKHLSDKQVIIFAAGTGNPFFTTDSAACLRGIEMEADVVLKATKVDGIYSDDPVKNPDATRYDKLTYHEVLTKNLQVMDLTAICLCQDHGLPLQVFDMNAPGVLKRIIEGESIGTVVGA